MHSYLRTIGFSDIQNKKELNSILDSIVENYDEKIITTVEENHVFGEYYKYYGHGFGIAVCGEFDENDEFQREYYFPFSRGSCISTQENITVEKHAGKDSFAGACDDVRVGVSIIFYLQNAGEYLKELSKNVIPSANVSLSLSALAQSATILLPIKKDDKIQQQNKEISSKRNRLLNAAKNGDEEAIENLTMEDIDIYSMISRRIADEDVYSIVDNYFMPFGMECDQYQLMGEIVSVEECKNNYTQEDVYMMELECNNIQMDVIVNKKDLLGEPQVGRRFKGSVWLQGYINFKLFSII